MPLEEISSSDVDDAWRTWIVDPAVAGCRLPLASPTGSRLWILATGAGTWTMLIINADDYGRSRFITDRILACIEQGSVTSTTFMVFMEDSERAAELAKGKHVDVGLHLNFTQPFTRKRCTVRLYEQQRRVAGFLTRSRFGLLVYNPMLRNSFEYVYRSQLEEFLQLFGKPPSHFDGHHHMHLCTNMLVQHLIPAGQKVRRSFSFWPGEKSMPNRAYRALVDCWLRRRYVTTDYFFSLLQCLRMGRLNRPLAYAQNSAVEVETHPDVEPEFDWLMGEDCARSVSTLQQGTYAQL